MKRFEAQITWTPEVLKCIRVPFLVIRPSFLIAGDLIASEVKGINGVTAMEVGKVYDVLIELPYGERYETDLHRGVKVQLQVGACVVAHGIVKQLE